MFFLSRLYTYLYYSIHPRLGPTSLSGKSPAPRLHQVRIKPGTGHQQSPGENRTRDWTSTVQHANCWAAPHPVSLRWTVMHPKNCATPQWAALILVHYSQRISRDLWRKGDMSSLQKVTKKSGSKESLTNGQHELLLNSFDYFPSKWYVAFPAEFFYYSLTRAFEMKLALQTETKKIFTA